MDMQFGELEQSGPQQQLRPDRNKHFAVAACGKPAENDLPIFVDLDVMRDMQRHAHRDTRVELGGVMLGGHFEDEQGRPFVLIQDSLRAEHYESTKGSFKFTHETWEKITRERERFPSDMAMVGWYHTHPSWGVFLSGMDMFICDHFFNKPLDVALVIDPCRRELGWFQWTGEPGERIRRTGGYYLISSRFRQAELRYYAAILDRNAIPDRKMSNDPRSELWDPAHAPTPVVHVHQSRSWIQDVAVLSMLMVQFFVLALLAWRILLPAGDAGPAADRLEARREVVEEVLARMDVDAPRLVSSLEETRQENAALQLDKTALASWARRLESQRDEAAQRNVWLEGERSQLEQTRLKLEAQLEEKDIELAGLQEQLDAEKAEATGILERLALPQPWYWIALAAVIVVIGICLVLGSRRTRVTEKPDDEPPSGDEKDEKEAS